MDRKTEFLSRWMIRILLFIVIIQFTIIVCLCYNEYTETLSTVPSYHSFPDTLNSSKDTELMQDLIENNFGPV